MGHLLPLQNRLKRKIESVAMSKHWLVAIDDEGNRLPDFDPFYVEDFYKDTDASVSPEDFIKDGIVNITFSGRNETLTLKLVDEAEL